jgi:hypothetical protein
MEILEKILKHLLQVYMNYGNEVIEVLLLEPNLARKERVGNIEGLEAHIYTNDHNPPHFHIKTKYKNI